MLSPSRESESSHASVSANRGTLRISESFTSRQGEGILTGTDTYFIRLSGCNLRCWFCDTPYASWNPSGRFQSITEIARSASDTDLKHVVLTGGEPLLPMECVSLAAELKRLGFHITIETAGTIHRDIDCDLMSISPKLASSAPEKSQHPKWHRLHQQRRAPISVMRKLIDQSPQFQIKFVVDSPGDFEETTRFVSDLQVEPTDIWIMPQGSTIKALDHALTWLKPWADDQGFQYCDRMQIRWFGNRQGT